MSDNIFNEQPEFISTDPRNERPEWLAYRIDPEFMRKRHEILLPGDALQGKSVLDLGSCNGASGAWALSHGATSYTGVELQAGYAEKSSEILAKYYPPERWKIIQASVEDFLSKPTGKFDVIIALGVVHAFANIAGFLNTIASRSQFIAIDGTHPYTIERTPHLSDAFRAQFLGSPDYVRFIENEPFVAMHRTGMSLQTKQTVLYDGYVPSMGFVTQILTKAGFAAVPEVNDRLKRELPNVYSPHQKFGLSFARQFETRGAALGLTQNISAKGKLPAVNWKKP